MGTCGFIVFLEAALEIHNYYYRLRGVYKDHEKEFSKHKMNMILPGGLCL